MSIDSVRNKCIKNNPDIDIVKLDADIIKQIQRFEKIVKTAYNESYGDLYRFINMPTTTKNEFFENDKLKYVHQHITMLIDLFDYQPLFYRQ